MFKRKYYYFTILLLVLMFILLGCAQPVEETVDVNEEIVDEEKEHITLRLGHSTAADGYIGLPVQKFADLIKEKSDGYMEVNVYPMNQLGDTLEMFEAIQLGSLEMMVTAPDVIGAFDPSQNVAALPFLYQDWDHLFAVLDGPLGEKLNEAQIEATGTHSFVWAVWGMRDIYTSGIEVGDISEFDFSKLDIRAPGSPIMIMTKEAFGANPSPVPWAELYTALQTRVVNSCGNSPSAHLDVSLYEVTDTCILTNHMVLPAVWVVSDEFYNGLPEWAVRVFDEAAAEAEKYAREHGINDEQKAYEKLKELGITFIEVEDKQFLQEAVKPIWEEVINQSELGMSVAEVMELVEQAK